MLRLIGYTCLGTVGFLPAGVIGKPKFYDLAGLRRLIERLQAQDLDVPPDCWEALDELERRAALAAENQR